MTDDPPIEADDHEAGAIGVGMGGSCPVCRAPVDLGQEFCLECGSPIRFTPRQRRQQRGAARGAGIGAAAAASTGRPPGRFAGFPWVPFLIVLALIGGGVAFALVDGGGDKGKDDTRSEPALSSIESTAPETTETSGSQTITSPGCNASGGTAGTTQPAIDPDATAPLDQEAAPGGTETIPNISSDGVSTQGDASDPFADQSGGAAGVPSTTPSGGEVVTVDESGFLCSDGSTGDSSSPTDPLGTSTDGTDTGASTVTDPTTTGTDTKSTDTSTSGGWPAGKEGWTVIVAGYPTESRAANTAADVKEDGFESGVLHSDEYQSLCPGYYVVFSGVFTTKSKANERLDALSATGHYAGMYAREVKTTGDRPASCTQARTPN